MDAQAEVEMGARRPARVSRGHDQLALLDALPLADMQLGAVAVGGAHPVAVVDDDVLAVDLVLGGADDATGARRGHGGAGGDGDVDALVELAPLQGWVVAVAEGRAHPDLGIDGPAKIEGGGQGQHIGAHGLGASRSEVWEEGLVLVEGLGGPNAGRPGPGDGPMAHVLAQHPGLERDLGIVEVEGVELGQGALSQLDLQGGPPRGGPSLRVLGQWLRQRAIEGQGQLVAEIEPEGGQQVHRLATGGQGPGVGAEGAHGCACPGGRHDQRGQGELGEAGEGEPHVSHPQRGRPCIQASRPTGARMATRMRPRVGRSGGSRFATARFHAGSP